MAAPTTAPARIAAPPDVAKTGRVRVRGKFLEHGGEKLYLRGVTYGTFRPGPDGELFPSTSVVERDFADMRAAGINAVRVYTAPPHWFLNLAHAWGLHVMVGFPWEQHTTFLDGHRAADIESRVRAQARACTGHPAVLCFVLGNEIPAPIVRWYGRKRVQRHQAAPLGGQGRGPRGARHLCQLPDHGSCRVSTSCPSTSTSSLSERSRRASRAIVEAMERLMSGRTAFPFEIADGVVRRGRRRSLRELVGAP